MRDFDEDQSGDLPPITPGMPQWLPHRKNRGERGNAPTNNFPRAEDQNEDERRATGSRWKQTVVTAGGICLTAIVAVVGIFKFRKRK